MMANRLLTLFILLLAILDPCKAQVVTDMSTNFTWVTTLPAEPLAVVADGPRGAYVLTKGNTLILLDNKGRERWKQTFSTWPTIQRLAITPTGNLVIAGAFSGQFTVGDSTYRLDNAFQSSTFIAEFDSTHTQRWLTYVLTPKGLMSQPVSLAIDATGTVMAFGRQAGTGVPFLCTFDADGRFASANVFGFPTIPAPEAVVVAADSKGAARMAITERTRSGSFGVLVAANEDDTQWRTYLYEALGNNATRNYDTTPVDIALDKEDNLLVLSNYTLIDRTLGIPIENGQVLLRYDATGHNQWLRTGVSRLDSAVATGVLADQSGAFIAHGGYDGPYDQLTNQYGTSDYSSLASYSPAGTLRWSTRLNAPTGTDRLVDVARAENGALLLLGKTTGMLPLGTLSVTGTSAAPAYFLAQLQPFVLRPASVSAVLCAGSSVPLSGTYTGYFEQGPVLQLSDAQGNFNNSQTVGNIPIGVTGAPFNATNFVVTVPLPGTMAAGTGYRLRAASALPAYTGDPLAVTVGVAPAIPAVVQAGEELVVSTSASSGVTYQWYTNSRQPVAGATSPRFRPNGVGAYYVVAVSGGCSSLPSEALDYIITATEPVANETTVYPNPATDRLWVRWLNGNADGQLELADLTGRIVRRQAKTGDVTEIMVSELPTGIYFLSLHASGQPTQVRKVLVR